MQCFVWLTLVLISALGIYAAEDQVTESKTSKDHDIMLLKSVVENSASHQKFEEFVDNATLSAAFSGCGLCQQTGQCDHAFHGQPGQFCIGMASGAPCCCPINAQCAAGPYECRCRRVVPSHYGGDDYHHYPQSSSSSTRRAQREREEQFVYAQPVATNQYGTYPGQEPQAPYAYASAPVAYGSSPYHEHGGGNTMAAGALGALGGLGVGAALGSAFGGRNNSREYSGDVGVSDNTYTFSGDTSGGGFAGDDGQDETFAGDSC
ncbi:unnamed protein product [Peronospora belbahrii]|uniref:EGF-like domain-containing protein n=1 Tax=Peronospora belbahrii TaxID=622444 RepID=A0AAU9KNN7_9STRA|nr:unnamed protein product [Peronospora belbahrii]